MGEHLEPHLVPPMAARYPALSVFSTYKAPRYPGFDSFFDLQPFFGMIKWVKPTWDDLNPLGMISTHSYFFKWVETTKQVPGPLTLSGNEPILIALPAIALSPVVSLIHPKYDGWF